MHLQNRVDAGAQRVVLAALLAAATALWLFAAPAAAADAPPKSDAVSKATADKSGAATATSPPSAQVDVAPPEEKDSATEDTGKRGKRSRPQYRIDRDPDFESFTNVMETAPWIVGLVFLVVGSVFLTPVILLVGIIWYKLRKTRMQNEAWLKLAEQGAVPPTQAAEAVSSGLAPPEAPRTESINATPTGSIVQQAVATRRRAVWSDLRKGVVMITIGLAFCFYSLFNDAAANWIGLVLLFLGVGYVVLWRLEDRHLAQRNTGTEAS